MHVDGFRFDLASTLARELHDVDRLSAFFDLIQQDPVVSQVKLIAEPWDVGEGGYQVGNFPVLWAEWNGKYRDTVRDFWRGERALAESPTASPARGPLRGRRPPPYASINFVTAHDGFTLRDLVSYNEKHNEANGEGNTTARTTTARGTAAPRGRPTTRRSTRCAPASSATCWPRCCSPRACRCCWAATRSAARSRATTTPTARTTSCPGSTGAHADQELLGLRERLIRLRREHPCFAAGSSSRAAPIRGSRGRATSPGSGPTAEEI